MRARWEGLHAALVRSVTTLQADRQFKQARETEAVLARFESPAGLIEHLASKDGDRDEKDAIYAALVRASQSRAPWADIAAALLWCGLWPGLDGVYRHRLRHFRDEPEELVAALSATLTSLVARLDLGRVNRVAATLVWSTDRELMEGRRREWTEQAHRHTPRADEGAPEPASPARQDSELGIPVGLSFAGELEVLRARLLPIAGVDTDLLLAVVAIEENQREAAERAGLKHEAARKRFQTVLRRVRADFREGLSQFGSETRV
jgi:RNA polymerase sigma-70 factor (ECF subfamily)